MKPRIILAETTLQDGSALELQEHDGRRYLLVQGQQICGPLMLGICFFTLGQNTLKAPHLEGEKGKRGLA